MARLMAELSAALPGVALPRLASPRLHSERIQHRAIIARLRAESSGEFTGPDRRSWAAPSQPLGLRGEGRGRSGEISGVAMPPSWLKCL